MGVGGPTLLPQFLGAAFGGACLRQHAGRGAQFRLRLLGLQLEIDFVERRERRAGIDQRANLDQALQYFSADAKSQIAFDPRADGADEGAVAGLGFVMDGSDQNGPNGGSVLGGDLVASGERQRQRSRRHDLR